MLYYKDYVENHGNSLLTSTDFNILYDALPDLEKRVRKNSY